ncbi:MAG: hypothetical protein JWM68_5101, partial [Verrucomicrobiales bacterium]|nr:hypothetical protein [Verrucomicrobiales bacterium]
MLVKNSRLLSVCCLGAFIANAAFAAESMMVIPQQFTLTGKSAHQLLIVETVQDKRLIGQITNDVTFASSDPKVLKIENGVALPVANGTATIVAKVGKKTAKAEVTVDKMDQPFEWNFRNQVQPVLAKSGCSSGPCHGAQAGQNGFKLSLRGYDDDGDYTALTRMAFGRRINFFDPGRSMILTKPTTALPHKGGKRFDINSPEYKVLSEWIA